MSRLEYNKYIDTILVSKKRYSLKDIVKSDNIKVSKLIFSRDNSSTLNDIDYLVSNKINLSNNITITNDDSIIISSNDGLITLSSVDDYPEYITHDGNTFKLSQIISTDNTEILTKANTNDDEMYIEYNYNTTSPFIINITKTIDEFNNRLSSLTPYNDNIYNDSIIIPEKGDYHLNYRVKCKLSNLTYTIENLDYSNDKDVILNRSFSPIRLTVGDKIRIYVNRSIVNSSLASTIYDEIKKLNVNIKKLEV